MSRLWCSYCGAGTHTAANCPKSWRGQAGRARLWCSYCGLRDHRASACPSLGRAGRVADDYVLDARPR